MRDSRAAVFLPAKLPSEEPLHQDPGNSRIWQPGEILAPTTHQMLLGCG